MKDYKQIQGWFNFTDVYSRFVNETPEGGIIVECGAWMGRSSAYLCDVAKTKNINVYIVDTWKGSINELDTFHKLAKTEDIFKIFTENMEGREYTPIVADSLEACKYFEDNSLDVVFIDMDHAYESVIQDIDAWLPKVKPGGYLAGHDYNRNWPGVVKAVNERFSQVESVNSCWIYKKPEIAVE